MIFRILMAATALALSALQTLAGPLEAVQLPPVTHRDAALTVVAPDGAEQVYSPARLEEFATYRLTTTTPWRDQPATFEGALLTDILRANGLLNAPAIMVTAENDFRTRIERAVWESMNILVATRVDGRPHTRRARGPIQFVIDAEEYANSPVASLEVLVWMASRIEAAD